jgi:predicted hotdog family 3-hydroxylacyl-ACP dehydratase
VVAEALPVPASVLPHRGSALWLDSVQELQPDRLLASGRIPAGSPFARDGACPAFAGLELCAQAVGYHAAVRGAGTSGPRRGYFVGAKSLELFAVTLPVGAQLLVEVTCSGAAGALATYRVRLLHEDRVALQGTVSLYLEQ